jgi:diamine N-acetyltransferase
MLTIAQATEAHFSTIQHIAHATWPNTFGSILSEAQIVYMLDMMYSTEALQHQVQALGHVFLLASEPHQTLGYISYELHYKNTPQTKIHKIYLLPQAQGKGVGKALIEAVVAAAQAHQNHALLLNVNKYNKAVGFYERLGFETIDQENIDIGNGFLMEDFVMKKTLK